ncbi:MAG: 6-phosphofructokinase [Firmicutes bacterium]|nr:6-phosphofructokinase [Bacillota bacterium]
MGKIGVLTSGGDAPGMNAAIRAVVRTGIYYGYQVVGIRRGFAGLLAGDMVDLELGSVADIIHRGGTVLRTARSEEFTTEDGQARARENLMSAGIEGLIVIGGDGSLKGATALLERGIPTIGVPATIDNDMAGTDLTIGFDTAINTAVTAIDRIRDTATSHERTYIIEVMGRLSGQIALAAGLAAGAESIVVPEALTTNEEICQRLYRGYQRGKRHSIIVVCEGAGSGYAISEYIQARTGLQPRVTVLGYIQRGGSPTAQDRILASRMGSFAVELLRENRVGHMVAIQGGQIVAVPMGEVVGRPHEFDSQLLELVQILAI